MKRLIAAMCFMLAAAPIAFAQDKAKDMEKKAPAATEKKAMEKAPSTAVMKGTGEEKKSPEKASMERPKGVSEGSQTAKEPAEKKATKAKKSDKAAKKKTPQQTKMGDCNKEAKEKSLKGAERKSFMKGCLSSKPK